MPEIDKNFWDLIIAGLTAIGALIGFAAGLHQWGKSQTWQRSAKLDELIQQFKTECNLRLAAGLLDWSSRDMKIDEEHISILNDDALLALRVHHRIPPQDAPRYPRFQARYRDAYDAVLDFFLRLEIAITHGLVDAAPAEAYFGYWYDRLISFDRHADTTPVLIFPPQTPSDAVIDYIHAYGDAPSLCRLARHFGRTPPPRLSAPAAEPAPASGPAESERDA